MQSNLITLEHCFLTGTDTEIGKTHSACALLHTWRSLGFSAAGYKPIAAGGIWQNGTLVNDDAQRIHAACSPGIRIEEVNPICLKAAIAPHAAAKDENRSLRLEPILAGYRAIAPRFERIVVEGVGGFRVPLGADFDSADLAVALGLPVVLVVGLRLGCINHALLTVEAILARKLTLAGWIGNTLSPTMPRQADTIDSLHQLIPAPCLGILPWSLAPADAIAALKPSI
ncbi:dethiobiotin synthase [Uliginosibacterium gangwonense]|uniref:dethiobiotin synthase n=1 Tax=Uliginosibacterium gangwonense TaxID=392736 RepID=UPI000373243B|nr:dethiobiotin synthase [Uliginosibacterium gangwonense]